MAARFTWLSGSLAAMLAMLSACGGGAFTAGENQGGSAGAVSNGGTDGSLGGTSAGGPSGGIGAAQGGAGGIALQGGKPGAGGRSASGGAPASGGIIGAGGLIEGSGGSTTGSCDSLWQNYSQEMQAARACSPDVAAKQCSIDYVLPDLCGCDVPANGTSEHYTKARELYTRWKRSCPAAACLVPCELDQGEPTCKSTTLGQSVCSF